MSQFKRDSITIPEAFQHSWQQITDLLSELIGVPAGLVMQLQGEKIQVLIASSNEDNPYTSGESEVLKDSGLYCEKVISSQQRLLVPNALKDPDWDHNPDIKLDMVSYLGFPLSFPDHTPFGTLCILDRKENAYLPAVEQLMGKFKQVIEANLEILYMNQLLDTKHANITGFLHEIKALRGVVPICSNCKSIRDQHGEWHHIEQLLDEEHEIGFSHGLCPKCIQTLYPELEIEI